MRDGPPNTLTVEARAKLNLFLRVLGPRSDGYHELQTLVLPVSLADVLTVHAFSDPGEFTTLSLSLRVEGDPELVRRIPADDSNLALRAAMALADVVRPRGFADLVLDKRIPAAAGLGGGSADAAAALRALNDLWGAALDDDAISRVGAVVGSDVPALLTGTSAIARGRGEVVDRLVLPPLRWAVAMLPFGVRTVDAFRWWDDDGAATGPDPRPLLAAARRGDTSNVGTMLYNDLEAPVMRRHPEVREVKEALLAAGAAGAVMCGSGPSVAALLPHGIPAPAPSAVHGARVVEAVSA